MNAAEQATLIVLGASGDLARKKIFPALFSLFGEGFLKNLRVVGYARTKMSTEEFREQISGALPCRMSPRQVELCSELKEDFLERLTYVSGPYDDSAGFDVLEEHLQGLNCLNRLYYFSIPPSVFMDAARHIRPSPPSRGAWTRVIMEKPFGRDLMDFEQLQEETLRLFSEKQIFRIDHYLGKELVMNILIMRFANVIFEPIWDRVSVESVHIIFKEKIGTAGRAGYFDNYGIIRDVMQNHLVQMLALIAMEPPSTRGAADVHAEKVKVLRSVSSIKLSDVEIGQYEGYLRERGVPAGSLTPTFARAKLFVNNRRWAGVPFYLSAGKALDERVTEIVMIFRKIPGGVFEGMASNELVIRVQPDEAINFRVASKAAGLSTRLVRSDLDLPYAQRYASANVQIPEAYERLLLDVLKDDKSLFIQAPEMREAWRIFTPVLLELEEKKVKPVSYPRGANEVCECGGACGEKYHKHLGGAVETLLKSREEFVAHALASFKEALLETLGHKEECLVGLSGGSTPIPFYEALDRIEGVDWTRVKFFLIDERYVGSDDKRSNLGLVRRSALSALKVPDGQLLHPDTNLPLQECVRNYDKELSAAFSWLGPPDVNILGIGPDGHIASLFPTLRKEQVGPNTVVNTQTRVFAASERITVTLDVLRSAQHSIFLLDSTKRDIWKRMLCSLHSGRLKDRRRWPALDLMRPNTEFVFNLCDEHPEL